MRAIPTQEGDIAAEAITAFLPCNDTGASIRAALMPRAGPHDLVRMMRSDPLYWAGSESQTYAEPKRLEQLGYLRAWKEPGVTRERTHYELTEQGLEALRVRTE